MSEYKLIWNEDRHELEEDINHWAKEGYLLTHLFLKDGIIHCIMWHGEMGGEDDGD